MEALAGRSSPLQRPQIKPFECYSRVTMVQFRVFPLVLTTLLIASPCACLLAQTDAQQNPVYTGKPVPEPKEPKPFAMDVARANPAFTIEFRSEDQVADKDRLVIADAESSIAEHAGVAGFEFEQGKWNYQQVVCPALPNHIFLQYTRNNGAGDVTVFSASIPRGGEGRVRIIPILRRGYSLFSPTPVNALTISAFNHIRGEEPSDGSGDWLGNGLCYAALAGAHPQVLGPDAQPEMEKPIPALTAVMDIQLQATGEEVIRFADAAAIPRPMEWTMTFTHKGKLIKATHSPAPMSAVRKVPQDPGVQKSWPVPQTRN